MKNPFFPLVLFCIALLTFSCAKEGPYLTEDGNIDPSSFEKDPGAGEIIMALPGTISGFTAISTFSRSENDLHIASRAFTGLNGQASLFFSAGDFNTARAMYNRFSDGVGMIQGTGAFTENFGMISSDAQLSGAWGFQMAQNSGLDAFSLSAAFDSQGSEKDMIQLTTASNSANGSYILPLATTLSGVAGWEIMDTKNGIAMLIVSIDGKLGFTIGASEQTNTNLVRSYLVSSRVNAIRNYKSL